LFIKTEKEMDKKIIKQENKTNLKEMLKNIDNNNLHGEIETESPEGKETCKKRLLRRKK
jgi:antitoxin component of MazEF toxin-antitoxin module